MGEELFFDSCHNMSNAPPPSPCTPYARRLPQPSLDRHLLAEVLQETFSGLAAAWNAPKRLHVFIGASPGSECQEAISPPSSNKENVRPICTSEHKRGLIVLDKTETKVGDEIFEEPSPFCCSAKSASGADSPELRHDPNAAPNPEELL